MVARVEPGHARGGAGMHNCQNLGGDLKEGRNIVFYELTIYPLFTYNIINIINQLLRGEAIFLYWDIGQKLLELIQNVKKFIFRQRF